jgi:hypothetical protein
MTGVSSRSPAIHSRPTQSFFSVKLALTKQPEMAAQLITDGWCESIHVGLCRASEPAGAADVRAGLSDEAYREQLHAALRGRGDAHDTYLEAARLANETTVPLLLARFQRNFPSAALTAAASYVDRPRGAVAEPEDVCANQAIASAASVWREEWPLERLCESGAPPCGNAVADSVTVSGEPHVRTMPLGPHGPGKG